MIEVVVEPTSLASESEETGTRSKCWSAERKATCASDSLLPETARKPSDVSARIEVSVLTAIGRTRLGADSDGFLRT